ncbi:outer membrane protein assembly factor BamB family protein [Neorhodopirellula lusitana]|uniref:outer membrane protein assembly factor BamB family protein n=1 Tax=Neorhodopirellula lusitana TaxID=445327 RepID=UPI00384FF3B0
MDPDIGSLAFFSLPPHSLADSIMIKRDRIHRCSLALIAFGLLAIPSNAQDWPSIRGPQYDGSAAAGDTDLAEGPLQLKVVWKRPIGSGYSGVVKSGDRLVSAMADVAADQEYVVAMSAETGETLWKTPTGKVMKGANGSFDGPVSTPAVDQVRAYHLSPLGILAAYSLDDGRVVWQHDLLKEYAAKSNFYGFGASPIVHNGVLIIPVGSPEGAVMGFDTKTGEVVWKAGQDGAAFQSAVTMELAGETAVLAACNTTLFAIAPATGKVIWSRPHGGASGEPVAAVVPVPLPGGGLFLNDSRDGSTGLNLQADGATERWSGRKIRNTYCVPVMSGGLLCSYSSRFLVAVDPETGDQVWRTRSPSNGFLATVAGRLVVATLDGSLHVGDVTEDGFHEAAQTQVFKTGDTDSEGLMWALPSIAGRSIYLRSLGAIARIDLHSGQQTETASTQESKLGPGFASFIQAVDATDDKQALIDKYLHGRSLPLVEDDFVHFILQGKYNDVAVASELFGVRQERAMQRIAGTDLFYFGVQVPEATRLSYVFFADYQPQIDPTSDRQFTSTVVAGEMEPIFRKPNSSLQVSWFDKGNVANDLEIDVDDLQTPLSGTIVETQLDSAELKEKVGLTIYLPPGYAESEQDGPDKDYPVVFVHDGKSAMESGNQVVIVDQLIQSKAIRPAVVVFIDKRFYPMQGATGYPEFFAKELLPKIDRDYRISKSRDDRASLSGGFGATLALMATLPVSNQIGVVGCHSPFAFEMLHPMMSQLSKLPNDRCQILVQWSRYDFRNPSENWNMADQSQVVAKILADGGHDVTAEGIGTGSDWVCWRTQSVRMWQHMLGR